MSCASHLCLHQSVDDGLQALVSVARQHSLKVLRAVLQGFGHRHVQIIVRLLCCQILCEHRASDEKRFPQLKLHKLVLQRFTTVCFIYVNIYVVTNLYSDSHRFTVDKYAVLHIIVLQMLDQKY